MKPQSLSTGVRVARLALFLVCLLVNASARAEVLYVSDTAFAVENKVQIEQPASLVWQALVQQVDQWWPKDHSGDTDLQS